MSKGNGLYERQKEPEKKQILVRIVDAGQSRPRSFRRLRASCYASHRDRLGARRKLALEA